METNTSEKSSDFSQDDMQWEELINCTEAFKNITDKIGQKEEVAKAAQEDSWQKNADKEKSTNEIAARGEADEDKIQTKA
eukprot:12181403-Ditylum_brightwellii.AAC.1